MKDKTPDGYEKRLRITIKTLLNQLQDFNSAFPLTFKDFLKDDNTQLALKAIASFISK